MKNTKRFEMGTVKTAYSDLGNNQILVTASSKVRADIETARDAMQKLTGNIIEIVYNEMWTSKRGHVMGGNFSFSTVTE